jgi:hypothetical protein
MNDLPVPPMPDLAEAQAMLCLAALTYREFADVGPPALHEERTRNDVAAKLASLRTLHGDWDLVWGPATYKAPLSLFDDAAMFVVKHRGPGDRYVVAVRGTNPIGAFDWLFGDMWVGGQTPWPFDPKGPARVSLSTALGLDILLQLRARAEPVTGAGRRLLDPLRGLRDFAATLTQQLLVPAQRDDVRDLRASIQAGLAHFTARRTGRLVHGPEKRLELLAGDWADAARDAMIAETAKAITRLSGTPSLHLLGLLEDDARLQARLRDGVDIVTFLKAAVRQAGGKLDVVVTGHSKGGALAPALALWLDETQRRPDADPFGWDPDGHATVRCWSFAGPTAGNAEFAARFDDRLRARCVRIHNPLDVVSHAWLTADLPRLAALYEPAIARLPAFEQLGTLVAGVLEQQHLGYTHIRTDVRALPAAVAPSAPEFPSQMIHQHLQGYFDGLGLGAELSVDTFFNPFR